MALAFVTQTTQQMRPVNFIIQQVSRGFENALGSIVSLNQMQKNLSTILKFFKQILSINKDFFFCAKLVICKTTSCFRFLFTIFACIDSKLP